MRGDLFLEETPCLSILASDLLHLRILGGRLLELVRLY